MPRIKALTPARSSWCICAFSRDCERASASSINNNDPAAYPPSFLRAILAHSSSMQENDSEIRRDISPTKPLPRVDNLIGKRVISIFSSRATLSPMVSASSVLPVPTSPERITNGCCHSHATQCLVIAFGIEVGLRRKVSITSQQLDVI